MNNTSAYTTLRYRNLSEAMEDMNLGSSQRAVTAEAEASVAVHLDPCGNRIVTLLKDLSEAAPITVSKSIDLVMDGKSLTLTTADAQLTFGADTLCSIDATVPGSSIRKECNGTSANLLVSDAQELLIRGGSYSLSGSITGLATGFRANAGKLELRDCTLEVNNSSTAADAVARTLFAAANARVMGLDATVKAEAVYKAYAVMTAGTMELHNTAVSGNATSEQGAAFTSVTVTVGAPGKLKLFDCTVTSSGETVCVTGIHNEGDLQLINCGMETTGVHNHTFGIMNTGTAAITGSTLRTESTDGNVFGIQNDNTLSLEKVTVTVTGENGTATGINNTGTLTCQQLQLNGTNQNDAVSGIKNSGTLTIQDSSIESSNETSVTYGIRNDGTLTVENMTVSVSSVDALAYGIQCTKQTDTEGNTVPDTGAAHITGLTVTADSTNNKPYGIHSSAELHLEESKVSVESQNSYAYGLHSEDTASIRRADIYANTNGENLSAYGIENYGTMSINDSKVMADAPGDNAGHDANATGIINNGTLFCEYTDVIGTLSGIQNNRYLFAQDGVFTGYSHGGFYFAHGEEGIAFVNDATLRCGHYSGVHEEIFNGNTTAPYGGSYVGGGTAERNSNITVYLDSCVFDSASSSYGLTLRGTSGETGNTVNMSNCSMIKADQEIRIDTVNANNGVPVSPAHHVNVGIGTGITAEMFQNPELTTFTQESYRCTRAYFKALVEAAATNA